MSCSSNQITITETSCPTVLTASEHRNYIVGETQPLNIDNLVYTASINNHSFVKGCSKFNKNFQSDLSILFLVKPENTKESSFTLPIYIAVIDSYEKLIDIQYYKFKGDLKKNSENKKYQETEFTREITINIEYEEGKDFSKNTIILGYMLDKQKLEILN